MIQCGQGEFVRTRTVVNPHTERETTVSYTAQGVPFISAGTETDLFFTQGRIVAENRLWQMEFFRRFMLGTLSEIYGNVTLQSDINHRRMRWVQICLKNIENTPSTYLAHLNAYISGVNDFLDECAANPSLLPPEFKQYDVPFPAPFSMVDTYLTIKALSIGLSGNANDEVVNQNVVDQTSLARFFQLHSRDRQMPYCLPPYTHSYWTSTNQTTSKQSQSTCKGVHPSMVFEDDGDFTGFLQPKDVLHKEDLKSTSELKRFLTSFAKNPTRQASNNWAVSGAHTNTGKPLVCNDPHLPYTAPMVWFLVGLDVTDPSSRWQNIIGATVIMAPGIGLGRNDHLAWGYTTDHADTQDVYLMVNNPTNTGYTYNSTTLQYEKYSFTVKVKDSDPVTVNALASVYGPVIVDGPNYYSVSFTAFNDTDTSLEAMMDSNIATNMNEWRNAMSKWWSLLFNAAYGDVEGNICFQAVGAIPVRKQGDDGLLPKRGDGTWDWVGITPFSDMPHSINPSQGFVVTANNPLGKLSQLAHPFPGTYVPGFRAQRIIDMLMDEINAGNTVDVDYMASIQGDVTDLVFSYLYPALERLVVSSEEQQYLQRVLAWDGVESVNSTEAPLFDSWLYCLYNVTFLEIGQSTNNPWMMSQWFNNAQTSGAGDDVSCSFWNQTCLEYASSCFSSAVNKYQNSPQWGDVHYGFFLHLPPLPLRWNRKVPVGGSKYTPNAATFTINIPGIQDELVVGGPSVRLIADLSGQTPNQMIMPMGESGVPTSDHYDDMLDLWSNLQYITLDWNAQ